MLAMVLVLLQAAPRSSLASGLPWDSLIGDPQIAAELQEHFLSAVPSEVQTRIYDSLARHGSPLPSHKLQALNQIVWNFKSTAAAWRTQPEP